VQQGQVYLWPLMAVLWAFDVEKVAERSLICHWVKDCDSVPEMNTALDAGRRKLKEEDKIRDEENLPSHTSMRGF